MLLLLIGVGSFLIIFYFQSNPNGFLRLVVLATSISFLFAPFVALFNLMLVTGKHIDEAAKPNKLMRWLSYFGIVFLTLFSIFYLLIDYILPYL